MFSPRSPSSSASTSPLDSRSLPRTMMRRPAARARAATSVDAAVAARRRRPPAPTRRRRRARHDDARASAPLRRAGLTCARRKRLSAGAGDRLMRRAPPGVAVAARARAAPRACDPARVPIEPAPSVITTSPGRAIARDRRRRRRRALGTTSTGRRAARGPPRPAPRA